MKEINSPEHLLSIIEIVNGEKDTLDRIEGVLLLAAGKDDEITPVRVARRSDIERSQSVDLFRQLEKIGVVEKITVGDSTVDTSFRIDPVMTRNVFDSTRKVIDVIDVFIDRQPASTTVRPLITFPSDPDFEGIQPSRFNMEWLMPALSTAVKQTEDEILILNPFFEKDGFSKLHEVIINALTREVKVTIVTRYLTDSGSHNREVLSNFLEKTKEMGINQDRITMIDYTEWEDGIPDEKKKQGGYNPSFTLHAKLMIFDKELAYIGSANVTDYGFEHYLEIGTLVSGPVVNDLYELTEFLLDSSAAKEMNL